MKMDSISLLGSADGRWQAGARLDKALDVAGGAGLSLEMQWAVSEEEQSNLICESVPNLFKSIGQHINNCEASSLKYSKATDTLIDGKILFIYYQH